MIELPDNLRLEKRLGHHGDTWICLERHPAGTWKNRQSWKPLTRPLYKTEILVWLEHLQLEHDVLKRVNQLVS